MNITELAKLQPYHLLDETSLQEVATKLKPVEVAKGGSIYKLGETLPGLFSVVTGRISIINETGAELSTLASGQHFGERGLTRDGKAVTEAIAVEPCELLLLAKDDFELLRSNHAEFAQFFERNRIATPTLGALTTIPVIELAHKNPITCKPNTPIIEAAKLMRDERISCILIADENDLQGILTNRDLANRVLAEDRPVTTGVGEVMTKDPISLSPRALGADALITMLDRNVGHLPIVDGQELVAILTQTDLIRYQAISASHLQREITKADLASDLANVTARIPQLLTQLVSAGHRHEAITRIITDITDAVTRRLLALAETQLGPPPVPYLWLACGSQGRREQTGHSDQDNCLFLADTATSEHEPYFAKLAQFVSDGLAECGYFKCPGDMMATNPRWRQPVEVWHGYFSQWVRKPDPMAQMLASVMFDLRPIYGDEQLFKDLQRKTLALAAKNSIFVAHMIANSIKHGPALGFFGGLATQRGDHSGTIDLKLNGVVPIVDLARVYALKGQLPEVGTRTRLLAAQAEGIISSSGGRDLIDAYDLIAETRLQHQMSRIQSGKNANNFLKPDELSDLEQHYLRDAFLVVKTMQSALGQGKAALT